jgi:hypothetical protein
VLERRLYVMEWRFDGLVVDGLVEIMREQCNAVVWFVMVAAEFVLR